MCVGRRRRRHKSRAAVRRVGDSVTWERFPHEDVLDNHHQRSTENRFFELGLRHALIELSIGACSISNLPAGLLDDLHLLQRLHLWGNLLETLPTGLFTHNANLVELLLWGTSYCSLQLRWFICNRLILFRDICRNAILVKQSI